MAALRQSVYLTPYYINSGNIAWKRLDKEPLNEKTFHLQNKSYGNTSYCNSNSVMKRVKITSFHVIENQWFYNKK